MVTDPLLGRMRIALGEEVAGWECLVETEWDLGLRKVWDHLDLGMGNGVQAGSGGETVVILMQQQWGRWAAGVVIGLLEMMRVTLGARRGGGKC